MGRKRTLTIHFEDFVVCSLSMEIKSFIKPIIVPNPNSLRHFFAKKATTPSNIFPYNKIQKFREHFKFPDAKGKRYFMPKSFCLDHMWNGSLANNKAKVRESAKFLLIWCCDILKLNACKLHVSSLRDAPFGFRVKFMRQSVSQSGKRQSSFNTFKLQVYHFNIFPREFISLNKYADSARTANVYLSEEHSPSTELKEYCYQEPNFIFNAKPFHLSKFVPILRLNIEVRKIVGFISVENQKNNINGPFVADFRDLILPKNSRVSVQALTKLLSIFVKWIRAFQEEIVFLLSKLLSKMTSLEFVDAMTNGKLRWIPQKEEKLCALRTYKQTILYEFLKKDDVLLTVKEHLIGLTNVGTIHSFRLPLVKLNHVRNLLCVLSLTMIVPTGGLWKDEFLTKRNGVSKLRKKLRNRQNFQVVQSKFKQRKLLKNLSNFMIFQGNDDYHNYSLVESYLKGKSILNSVQFAKLMTKFYYISVHQKIFDKLIAKLILELASIVENLNTNISPWTIQMALFSQKLRMYVANNVVYHWHLVWYLSNKIAYTDSESNTRKSIFFLLPNFMLNVNYKLVINDEILNIQSVQILPFEKTTLLLHSIMLCFNCIVSLISFISGIRFGSIGMVGTVKSILSRTHLKYFSQVANKSFDTLACSLNSLKYLHYQPSDLPKHYGSEFKLNLFLLEEKISNSSPAILLLLKNTLTKISYICEGEFRQIAVTFFYKQTFLIVLVSLTRHLMFPLCSILESATNFVTRVLEEKNQPPHFGHITYYATCFYALFFLANSPQRHQMTCIGLANVKDTPSSLQCYLNCPVVKNWTLFVVTEQSYSDFKLFKSDVNRDCSKRDSLFITLCLNNNHQLCITYFQEFSIYYYKTEDTKTPNVVASQCKQFFLSSLIVVRKKFSVYLENKVAE
ncbi:hypothetical protein EGR_06497 [Echinococcus granulosus]|uniref:Uncharacterized protein n=1 Tax=Echinococcus granulosus TaxID=6210 RepID=W6UYH0_ECHGR|nr:hypothetical protein EGR_06497 [Echinococcus granulosus]EUB58614.1 hypothetical protein EGR_06497 [Echinococcus granulosus]